ncbi:MAG: hypothetical protein P4M08_06945 [Oligoflexia bacterium]|nr:hypothetical protein [Oligoflexia bacterium]
MHASTPTNSAIIKKIVEVNPELSVFEVMQIVRQSVQALGPSAGEDFAHIEVIDEQMALSLARQTLYS